MPDRQTVPKYISISYHTEQKYFDIVKFYVLCEVRKRQAHMISV